MQKFQCTTARRVLELCEHGAFELDEVSGGHATWHWLFRWFAILAALRAVGHATLVDASDPNCPSELKQAVGQAWKELNDKREPIFHYFIERDRNAVFEGVCLQR